MTPFLQYFHNFILTNDKTMTKLNSLASLFLMLLFALFTTTEAQAATAEAPAKKEEQVTLKVTGMTCGGCASHVSTTLQKLDGVLKDEVRFPGDVAIVTFDPEVTDVEAIIASIEGIGYKAEIVKNANATEAGEASAKVKNCGSKKKGGCCSDK